MARLDSTAIWFQRGEDETAMAETPAAGPERRRVPTLWWVAGAVALTTGLFCGVVLHLSHAARVVAAPLAEPSAMASAAAAAAPTQTLTPITAPATITPTPSTQAAMAPTSAAPTAHAAAHAPSELAAAEQLLRRGHAAQALAQFQRTLQHDANDVRALRGACLSLFRLDRLDDAARVCRRALERAPADLEARRTLATIYYQGGAYKWSVAEWRRVVQQAPRDAHARRALQAAQARARKG